MYPRSLNWFEMVDRKYDDELWYSNFQVTRGIFEFLLNEIMEYIRYKGHSFCNFGETTAAYYIILLGIYCSAAEYRTIANLFGVSISFVCLCARDVYKAITSNLSHDVNFPHGDELVQIINDYA